MKLIHERKRYDAVIVKVQELKNASGSHWMLAARAEPQEDGLLEVQIPV